MSISATQKKTSAEVYLAQQPPTPELQARKMSKSSSFETYELDTPPMLFSELPHIPEIFCDDASIDLVKVHQAGANEGDPITQSVENKSRMSQSSRMERPRMGQLRMGTSSPR